MKIILCGACGRMGKNVAETAAERNVTIAAGVDVIAAPAPFQSCRRHRTGGRRCGLFLRLRP